MINQCNFIGRLGADPEQRFTQDGTAVVNGTLACSEKYKDKEHTEWVRYVAFGRLAEIMGEYLKKGALIFISGKMQTRQWDDNNGNKRYTTEIVVRDMKMLGGNTESNTQSDRYEKPSTGDDLPF